MQHLDARGKVPSMASHWRIGIERPDHRHDDVDHNLRSPSLHVVEHAYDERLKLDAGSLYIKIGRNGLTGVTA